MAILHLPLDVGERYDMYKKLRALGVYVAGWERIDLHQFKDIYQKQIEVMAKEPAPPPPLAPEVRKEVGKAIKEYRKYLDLRKAGSRKLLY